MKLHEAQNIADSLLEIQGLAKHFTKYVVCGSIRRKKEDVIIEASSNKELARKLKRIKPSWIEIEKLSYIELKKRLAEEGLFLK